ncbi:MAG: hypothetical protein RMA76_46180 [Deltaproteobacteria bacterium]
MRQLAIALVVVAAACEGTIDPIVPIRVVSDAGVEDPDGGARDGGTPADAGHRDGGVIDGGTRDGGHRDGGPQPRRDGGTPTTLQACPTSLGQRIQDLLDEAPGRDSEGYVPLPAAARTPLRTAIAEVLAEDEAALLAVLPDAEYGACRRGTDAVQLDPAPGTGRALIVIRPRATRAVIVGAPHAMYEIDTATVARAVYDEVDALALVVSAAHRCANQRASGCSGETTACSAQSMPYVESDTAHNVVSAFHLAHEALLDGVATSTAISLHGKGGNGAVLSNGTMDVTTEDALVARAVQALQAERPADAVLTCNRFPGGQVAGQLCGTTNVQGRHANGSPMACTVEAASARDRFLHLELPLSIRSDPDAVSATVLRALP